MSNVRPMPHPAVIIRCVLAAAAIQDRATERRVQSLRPHEFKARGDLITRDGYAPLEATRAVLALRWEEGE